MKNIVEVTDGSFETEVLKSNLPVLVDFWAPWCGPCRMMSPVLEAAAEKLSGRLKFAKLNTDQNIQVASRFGIMAIPTLVVFDKGLEKNRMIGFIPQEELESQLQSIMDGRPAKPPEDSSCPV
jgi:thioredoxin 1